MSQTALNATRYGAGDHTTTPGDLKITPPPGDPPPENLHVDNASGLDSRVVQTPTPFGPGALTQSTDSRAKSWNNTLASASVQRTAGDLAPVNFSTAGKSDLEACFRWFIHMRIHAQRLCVMLVHNSIKAEAQRML